MTLPSLSENYLLAPVAPLIRLSARFDAPLITD
jgi:hypothetical protein